MVTPAQESRALRRALPLLLACVAMTSRAPAAAPEFKEARVVVDCVVGAQRYSRSTQKREVIVGGRTIGRLPQFHAPYSSYWRREVKLPIPDKSLVRDGMTVRFRKLRGCVANVHVELVLPDGSIRRSTLDPTRYTDLPLMPNPCYRYQPLDVKRVLGKGDIETRPLRFDAPAPVAAPGKGRTFGVRITKLKRYVPDTDLVRGGAAVATLVTAGAPESRALTQSVAERLRDTYGVRIPVKTRGEVTLRDMATRNLVFVGPPAGDAYVYHLRTRHDPYGFGVNQVYLGGVAYDGVGRGVDAFVKRLRREGDRVFLPPTFLVKPNDYVARNGEEAGDQDRFQSAGAPGLRRALEGRLRNKRLKMDALAYRREFLLIAICVQRYYESGDPDFLAGAKAGYLLLTEIEAREKDPRRRYGQWPDDTHAWRAKVVAYWDMIEDEPVWTDAERLKVTQAILQCAADPVPHTTQLQHLNEGQPHGPRWSFQNHETGGITALAPAYAYFATHYPNLEWLNEWDKHNAAVMARQARCYSTNENSNGYQFYGLEFVQAYMDYSHDKTFLWGGNLYRLATEHLMKHDSLGVVAGLLGAASGHISPRNAYMALAGDLYGEPKFRYMEPRSRLFSALIPTQPRLKDGKYYGRLAGWRRFDPIGTRDRVLPVDHVGVTPLFLDRGLDWQVAHGRYGKTPPEHDRRRIPRARALDKLSFRAGFHPDDDHLLIDGWGGRGAHSWNSGNAIVSYTRNRRIWLTRQGSPNVEESRPEVHNTVTVRFNGEARAPAPFTGLEYLGDFTDTAFAGTSKKEQNRCDWTRHTIQVRNRFFVVADEVAAREAGDFDVRVHWHVMGRASILGPKVFAKHAGDARFELVNVSDLEQRASRAVNSATCPILHKSCRMYPYVEPYSKVLSFEEGVKKPLRKGERVVAINAFYSYLTRDAEWGYDARAVGERQATLANGEGVWHVGLGPVERPGLRAACKTFVIGKDCIAGVGVTEVVVGGRTLFKSTAPAAVEIRRGKHLGAEATLLLDTPATVTFCSPLWEVDGEKSAGGSATLAPGRHFLRLHPDGVRKLLTDAAKSTQQLHAKGRAPKGRMAEPPTPPAARAGLPVLWQVSPCKPSAEERKEGLGILQGLIRKRVGYWEAVTRDWNACRQALCADVDGDGVDEVLLALKDGRLLVLNADGKPRFEFATPTRQSVNCVDVADIDGDGDQEIAIGSDDQHVYLLDAKGKLVWKTEPVVDWGGALSNARFDPPGRKVTLVKMLDRDGDGRKEVYAATALSTKTTGQHIGLDATGRQFFAGWSISRYKPITFFDTFKFGDRTCLITGSRGFILDVRDRPTAPAEIEALVRQFPRLGQTTPETKKLRLAYPRGRVPGGGAYWWIGDIDGDGVDEIATTRDTLNVWWYQGKGGNKSPYGGELGRRLAGAEARWRGGPRGVAVIDLDGDGKKEIVAANRYGLVRAWRLSKAEKKLVDLWRLDLRGEIKCLAAASVGGKARIVAARTDALYVLDGAGKVVKRQPTRAPAASLHPARFGRPAVVVREANTDRFDETGSQVLRFGGVAAYAVE